MSEKEVSIKDEVLKLVSKIPYGKVSSYGRIAKKLNLNPRIIGYILSGMKEEEMLHIPWHRVVDRNGFVSSIKLGDKGELQKQMLIKEEIKFQEYKIINVEEYWFEF